MGELRERGVLMEIEERTWVDPLEMTGLGDQAGLVCDDIRWGSLLNVIPLGPWDSGWSPQAVIEPIIRARQWFEALIPEQ